MGLLKRVTYALKQPIPYSDLAGDEIQVIPTFPYNEDSKTQPKTAKDWASCGWRDGREVFPAPEIETNNEPFSIRIVGLEKRSEGGRAYKVIDADGKLMDLREDQVLEAMCRQGIKAGGEILGPFQWAVRGSQMTLMFVGGNEWTRMKQETETKDFAEKLKKEKKAITASKLVVGGLYKRISGNKKGQVCVYIGAIRLDKKKLYVISELYNEQYVENNHHYCGAIKFGLKRDITKMSYEEIFQAKMECHDRRGEKYTIHYDSGYTFNLSFEPFTYFEAHSSPKFDLHVGTVDAQRLIDLRSQIDLHRGDGSSLSDKWYKLNFGADDPMPDWHKFYLRPTRPWHQGQKMFNYAAAQERFDASVLAWKQRANLKYNETLEWL